MTLAVKKRQVTGIAWDEGVAEPLVEWQIAGINNAFPPRPSCLRGLLAPDGALPTPSLTVHLLDILHVTLCWVLQ